MAVDCEVLSSTLGNGDASEFEGGSTVTGLGGFPV